MCNMENKKIILLIFIFLFYSCIKKNEYKKIKFDLFTKDSILYLEQKAENFEFKGKFVYNYDSLCVLNSKIIVLNKIIDIKTFQRKKNYYIDKNHIYFHNWAPLYFPDLNAIPSRSKILILYHGDYVSTDNKVYFKSKQIKNVDIKTFKVTNKTKDGFYFAFDKNKFYYKNITITEDQYMTNKIK
jgi:DKNYY family